MRGGVEGNSKYREMEYSLYSPVVKIQKIPIFCMGILVSTGSEYRYTSLPAVYWGLDQLYFRSGYYGA